MPRRKPPTLAVFKFASCDGCQLGLLGCEDELLEIAGAVRIAHFLEASSAIDPGPWDLALVEGSITTPRDRERILEIRRRARRLVTIGACATSGGIQALRNFADHEEWLRVVYARPDYVQTLARSTGIAEHVPVDFELRGCPIAKEQLLEVLIAFLHGRRPAIESGPVCVECKRRGLVCVMVARGTPCLGPVTHAGCGALCPRHDRGCYGCFGPSDAAHTGPLAARLVALGMPADEVSRSFLSFNAGAPAFRDQGVARDE